MVSDDVHSEPVMTVEMRKDHDQKTFTADIESMRLPQPALASIPAALRYLGSPSRSKFYADLLPQLEVVRFGSRTFVTYKSLDSLIARHRQSTPSASVVATPRDCGDSAIGSPASGAPKGPAEGGRPLGGGAAGKSTRQPRQRGSSAQ
jgi:hypothetical protein